MPTGILEIVYNNCDNRKLLLSGLLLSGVDCNLYLVLALDNISGWLLILFHQFQLQQSVQDLVRGEDLYGWIMWNARVLKVFY